MTERMTLEAIVLKRWDFGEKDQIVSFLSRERGRLQGIAKGAKASRRRFAGSLDLFCLSEITFKEKKTSSLVFIEEARLLDGFEEIRRHYNSILLAQAFLEMGYQLYREGEGESHSFHVLREALHTLKNQGVKKEMFWSVLLENLKVIGLEPQFERCVRCNSDSPEGYTGFDVSAGGVVCPLCTSHTFHGLKLSPSIHHWLKSRTQLSVFQNDLGLEDQSLLHCILKGHLKYQMDLDLDWDRFLQFFDSI